MVITADNVSSGFAGAAFVVYLSGLTSIKFTATQYALFSSIMLFSKLVADNLVPGLMWWLSKLFCSYCITRFASVIFIIWIAKVAPVRN